MEWLTTTFTWWIYLFVLGLICLPLAKIVFGRFFDKGYPFAKTIAILLISYFIFAGATLKIISFTRISVFLVVFTIFLVNIYIAKKITRTKKPKSKHFYSIIFFEEILFCVSFFFLSYVRAQEPAIHGLEKFMDFGFMNSILRAGHFPPLDMWYGPDALRPNGYPINYYFFGHITGAVLIKLTATPAYIAYNLILSSIFAQAITLSFSIAGNLVHLFKGVQKQVTHIFHFIFFGLLGSFIVNLAGNLHTIYLFTKGYPNDKPIPFWHIFSSFNPQNYWYPNATRFIPFTIHEFPSYSWVVADLHGHIFDIPFVLLTIATIILFFTSPTAQSTDTDQKYSFARLISYVWGGKISLTKIKNYVMSQKSRLIYSTLVGFLIASCYMTNATDGPTYLLFSLVIFFIIYRFTAPIILLSAALLTSFFIFTLPFSLNFKPFISGIGVNCGPVFTGIQKIGPFLFEGNCQASPLWMLFVLWGFFIIVFILFLTVNFIERLKLKYLIKKKGALSIDYFIAASFCFGIFLIVVPEFFYIKDIYPAHFRANTMFKLGYQAFIICGLASSFVFYRIRTIEGKGKYVLKVIYLFFFSFIFLYPFFAFPSFYGKLNKKPSLDGGQWMMRENMKADREIINYLNGHVAGYSVILEAQGDSYTNYNRISAYTGLPTPAGWWVHEWLWRGSPDVVGSRIPDIQALYESPDLARTHMLIQKYSIRYIVISDLERQKYKNINTGKFDTTSTKVYESSDKKGLLYRVN